MELLLIYVSQGLWRMFITLVAAELKVNEMLLVFAAHPHSTVSEQEGLK